MKTKIKKGKITMTIIIGIICFILVLVMSMQFKIINQTDITSIENMRQSELRTELANWKARYEETDARYQEVMSNIEEYKQNEESNEQTEALVNKELEEVNMSLGKTDVQGKGIEVILTDVEDETVPNIEADDLLVIVNALKLAGAEAISINGERIINMSDIVDVDEYIKVNGNRILSPYIIKAIGNQTYLESQLIGNGGYVDDLRKSGCDVEIQKYDNVEIPKYNGEIKTKYIE